MTAPTPDLEALASRLHVAAIHLLRWLRREDDAAGLSAAQLSVISTLIRLGPSRIGDLACAERVTAPTMTRLVQRLERDGLVVRRAGKEDRRQSVVAVTHRAWMLLENGRKRRAEALRERLEDLSAAERRSLAGAVALLERIVDR